MIFTRTFELLLLLAASGMCEDSDRDIRNHAISIPRCPRKTIESHSITASVTNSAIKRNNNNVESTHLQNPIKTKKIVEDNIGTGIKEAVDYSRVSKSTGDPCIPPHTPEDSSTGKDEDYGIVNEITIPVVSSMLISGIVLYMYVRRRAQLLRAPETISTENPNDQVLLCDMVSVGKETVI